MWWAQRTELSQGWSIKSSWVRFFWPPEMELVYSSLSCLLKNPLSLQPSKQVAGKWRQGKIGRKRKVSTLIKMVNKYRMPSTSLRSETEKPKTCWKSTKCHTHKALTLSDIDIPISKVGQLFFPQWEHSLATEKQPREARSKGNIQLLNPSSSPRTNRFSHRKKRVQSISGNTDHSAQRELSFYKQRYRHLGSLTRTSSLFSKGKSLGLAHSHWGL